MTLMIPTFLFIIVDKKAACFYNQLHTFANPDVYIKVDQLVNHQWPTRGEIPRMLK